MRSPITFRQEQGGLEAAFALQLLYVFERIGPREVTDAHQEIMRALGTNPTQDTTFRWLNAHGVATCVIGLTANLQIKPPRHIEHQDRVATGEDLRIMLRRNHVARCTLSSGGVAYSVLVFPGTMQSCRVYDSALGTVERKPLRGIIGQMDSVIVEHVGF